MWELSEQASDLTKHTYLRKKEKDTFFSLHSSNSPSPACSRKRNPWPNLVDIQA